MHNSDPQPMCRPLVDLVPRDELEAQNDKFGDLLQVLADLVVETRARRSALAALKHDDDPRIVTATESLTKLEHHLMETGIEAALVHNELRHAQLI